MGPDLVAVLDALVLRAGRELDHARSTLAGSEQQEHRAAERLGATATAPPICNACRLFIASSLCV